MNYKLTRQEDEAFQGALLRDIPYFHQLYAKYKNPQHLETAKLLGEVSATLKKRTYD